MIRLKKLLTKNLNEAPQAEDLVNLDVFRSVIEKRISRMQFFLLDSKDSPLNSGYADVDTLGKQTNITKYNYNTQPQLFKLDEELTLDFSRENQSIKKKKKGRNIPYTALDKTLIANELVRGKIQDDEDGGDPYVYFVLGKKQAPDFMVDNLIIQIYFPGSKIQSRGRIGFVGGDLEFKDPRTGEYRKVKD